MGKPYKNGENGGESSFLTSLLQRRAGNSWSAIIPSYHSCTISPPKCGPQTRMLASPGELLEMHTLRPYPVLMNQKLGGGSAVCALTNPSGDSDAREFENGSGSTTVMSIYGSLFTSVCVYQLHQLLEYKSSHCNTGNLISLA